MRGEIAKSCFKKVVPQRRSSCPDLIRASIHLRRNFRSEMDCRVKPGNDEGVHLVRLFDGVGGRCSIRETAVTEAIGRKVKSGAACPEK
jgi:hypothetical protein